MHHGLGRLSVANGPAVNVNLPNAMAPAAVRWTADLGETVGRPWLGGQAKTEQIRGTHIPTTPLPLRGEGQTRKNMP